MRPARAAVGDQAERGDRTYAKELRGVRELRLAQGNCGDQCEGVAASVRDRRAAEVGRHDTDPRVSEHRRFILGAVAGVSPHRFARLIVDLQCAGPTPRLI